jgi:predicted Zn finger-like uncharacterized protein
MSLICPDCQATYNVNPDLLGPNGRKVRCATCGHIWMALPPMPLPPEKPIENPFENIAAPTAAAAKTSLEDGPQIRIIPPENIFASMVAQTAAKAEIHEETHQTFRPIETAPPQKPDGPIMLLFRQLFIPASLVMLAIFAGILILARSDIARRAPEALAVYNFFGINPLPPGGGLALLNVHDESRFSQLDNALVVHGDLVNRTSAELKVPLFKMDITSPGGQTKTFMARGPVDKIEGGAIVPFTLERAGFAAEGWDVKLSFGDGTEKESGKPMQSVNTPKPGK